MGKGKDKGKGNGKPNGGAPRPRRLSGGVGKPPKKRMRRAAPGNVKAEIIIANYGYLEQAERDKFSSALPAPVVMEEEEPVVMDEGEGEGEGEGVSENEPIVVDDTEDEGDTPVMVVDSDEDENCNGSTVKID